ncbi:glycosyltransferase family 8 protein [Ephemerocybe angulata]|uniref:Glycosyltransferase family 8 protein n=1 Tax=Ephemerocybe angulata TaxID=980116 RepID=A0A8H6IID2_9AGAR|nr:glycosyltransferase family 8 protein [Tulosesus angulatus]
MANQVLRRLAFLIIGVLVVSFFYLGKDTFRVDSILPARLREGTLTPSSQANGFRPDASTPPVSVQEPIVFSLIMWSKDSALEGALLIKSIVMHNSRPTDIHVICDDEAEDVLRSRLQLVTRPRYPVRVWYIKPTWQAMYDRVEREGSLKTDHSAGLPGLMKLFIHELLPRSVTKSIFVDTDAFFITDPSLLWEVFDTLQPQTAVVMASHPNQYAPEWHDASKICSCVILLDLKKLRDARLMASSVYTQIDPNDRVEALGTTAFKAMYGLPGGDGKGRYDNVRLGDQGYWWAIVDYHQNLFEPLSYDFEVTSCIMDMYFTGLGDDTRTEEDEESHHTNTRGTPQEGKVVLPKLLHFNCLHNTTVYMEWTGWKDPDNYLNYRWGAAMKFHNGYKWIWLNQGDRGHPAYTIEQHTRSNATFLDEDLLKSWRHTHQKHQH